MSVATFTQAKPVLTFPDSRPIDTAKHNDEEPLLLFCPDQGGWHTGIWFDGKWQDFTTMSEVLLPTHWMPVPPDPFEA
jgi:hypothetical protein